MSLSIKPDLIEGFRWPISFLGLSQSIQEVSELLRWPGPVPLSRFQAGALSRSGWRGCQSYPSNWHSLSGGAATENHPDLLQRLQPSCYTSSPALVPERAGNPGSRQIYLLNRIQIRTGESGRGPE